MLRGVQADAAAVDGVGRRASALLAASQASAQLKASQIKEQHIVSAFLLSLSEKVLLASP